MRRDSMGFFMDMDTCIFYSLTDRYRRNLVNIDVKKLLKTNKL